MYSKDKCQKGDDIANPDLLPPPAGDFTPSTCWNFSIGDRRSREFYSPNYPENYVNNSECMQLLTAPPGYRIRLDFRDDFHIEASEGCTYDFLELRDGPFGYSPLVGRFCGKKHPPMVDSTSRFLWIRFKADETIEYSGFRAVYEFFKPTSEDRITTTNSSLCRIAVNLGQSEGTLHTSDIPEKYIMMSNSSKQPLDCTWVFYAQPGHRLYMRWMEFKMSTPQDCEDSFMELYDRTTATTDRRKQVCGLAAREFKSVSNHVYLRVYAVSPPLLPSFFTHFTIFTPGPCTSSQFDCGDNACIPNSLRCNGNVNCNYSWDEESCDLKPTTTEAPVSQPIVITYSTIILGAVGGFIVTVISLAVFVTCHQHRKEERRRKQALQQERRHNPAMTSLLNRESSPCLTQSRLLSSEMKNGDIKTGQRAHSSSPTFRHFHDVHTVPAATACSAAVCVEKHARKSKSPQMKRPVQNHILSRDVLVLHRRLSLETISDVWKPSMAPLHAQRSVDSIIPTTDNDSNRTPSLCQHRYTNPTLDQQRSQRLLSHELDDTIPNYHGRQLPRGSDDRPQAGLHYSKSSGSLTDSQSYRSPNKYYMHDYRSYAGRSDWVKQESRRSLNKEDRTVHAQNKSSRCPERHASTDNDRRRARSPSKRQSTERTRSSGDWTHSSPSRYQSSTEDRTRSSPSRSKYERGSSSPDMFYSRPSRYVQHHPV